MVACLPLALGTETLRYPKPRGIDARAQDPRSVGLAPSPAPGSERFARGAGRGAQAFDVRTDHLRLALRARRGRWADRRRSGRCRIWPQHAGLEEGSSWARVDRGIGRHRRRRHRWMAGPCWHDSERTLSSQSLAQRGAGRHRLPKQSRLLRRAGCASWPPRRLSQSASTSLVSSRTIGE